MKPETMMADGDECYVNHTSALECWLIMHSMRRVLNGGEDFPKRKGRLVHVASDPLQPKEIAFIEEMHAGGACPSVKMFEAQFGTVVGVTDFEVRETTTLPGWDGSGKPAVLSNPKWYQDGVYVPVPPDYQMSEDGASMEVCRGFTDDSDLEADGDDVRDIKLDELPLPVAAETDDFTWVKDRAMRESALAEYEKLCVVLKAFVNHRLRPAITEERWNAAIARLGVSDGLDGFGDEGILAWVVEDYAAMLDDSTGRPVIAEILEKAGDLSEIEKRAAEYFKAYRYTWLKVEAVKTGVGMKCLDLMTGKNLFLLDPKESNQPDVKGMTLCSGIAPAGRYHINLGMYHPANFDNAPAILKIVLTHLGLPTELPISLSPADTARFAAETINRIYKLGHF